MSDLLKPNDLRKIADDLDMAKAKKMLEHMKAEEAGATSWRRSLNSLRSIRRWAPERRHPAPPARRRQLQTLAIPRVLLQRPAASATWKVGHSRSATPEAYEISWPS
jgi:hypothetical protein